MSGWGNIIFAAAGFLAGAIFFALLLRCWKKRQTARIQALEAYLEQAVMGRVPLCKSLGEDTFSRLEDEIYKTVTSLYQTRDAAVQARNAFAENLSNIAHQIKTPITAISLSVQMLQKEYGEERISQIQKQLVRLTHLEEALLVLSRLDAGTLALQREEIDVFTVLMLAADNLQELFAQTGTSVEIPELGEMAIAADLDWTMEAVMNLMKNCMEHNTGGTVHCSYGQNPLYTEIMIWDEGEGFARVDIPHLFERFYRGEKAG
ncbi:MAG: HAMP domain-containing histidine kinase [Lachnospiraceae bacterium]|nr:HAMP domain-containing histidine kinase [Lachnospiraceae bacterium]